MPKIDLAAVPVKSGSSYPAPYAAMVAGRSSLRLGEAGGLTQFGANVTILAPGSLSSMRHWHAREDEFVMMLTGTCVLVEDGGETVMRPGDCAAFPAGVADGHHFRNDGAEEARFLVVGSRSPVEDVTYSDVDMRFTKTPGGTAYTRRDGSPFPADAPSSKP